jgi:protease prsW family protein/zinc ribbon protein
MPAICPRCSTENPEVARFCFRCGRALLGADQTRQGRAHSYAVQPGEGVVQFALISTIMPHTNRRAADHYRWALLASAVLVVGFSLAGLLPGAIVGAAFLVPATYLIYVYDMNLWEESPVPVVLALFLFTGLLAAGISIGFFQWLFRDQLVALIASTGNPGGVGRIPVGSLLVFAVALPVVAEVAKELGPLWLARRAEFDDMIDGFTFGVAAGTAYAAFETVVAFAAVFRFGHVSVTDNLASWLVIVVNLMLVKSLIYGSATGIAVASFSGRGQGYDGLSPSYAANFGLAVVANVLYWLGIRLLAYAPFGQALGLLWGLLIATALIVRVRVMLHAALLEAAVEDAANERRAKGATTETGFCPECEVVLLPDSMFCIACGTSVRATSGAGRRHIREVPSGAAR